MELAEANHIQFKYRLLAGRKNETRILALQKKKKQARKWYK